MDASNILFFGAGVIGIGLLVLGAVMAELRRHHGAGLMIALGLGLGIVAFGAKLGLIIAFDRFGSNYIAHFLPAPERHVRPMALPAQKAEAYAAGYVWHPLPLTAPAPKDNPTTPEKAALGQRLFHDARLSVNDKVACASCHDIRRGGADGRAHSLGFNGQTGSRNAPTVLNAAYQAVLFWDGRAASLEEQAKGPLTNPIEMGMADFGVVEDKVAAIPEYRRAFARVFGGVRPVSIDNIAKAIAAFERTLVTPSTPYDRFVRGDRSAMSPRQIRGMGLFAEFGCVMCHRGPNFSDASLLAGAAPLRAFPSVPNTDYEKRYRLAEDTGASHVPGERGVWRIPSLRNVTKTSPYFHNGAVQDLREAVRIMAHVQLGKPSSNVHRDDWRVSWSPVDRTITARSNEAISDDEVDDIVAFLHALEGDVGTDGLPGTAPP